MPLAAVQGEGRAARVVATAVLRTADLLGMSGRALAATIGVSESGVSRLRRGGVIDPDSKSGELSLLLVRLFRNLDAVVGGDGEKARRWFHAHNDHLGGTPVELVQSVRGLSDVIGYLEAMRGRS